jgi:hypothetical protein
MKKIFISLICLFSSWAAAQVQDESIKITKIDVFKNGTAFVVSEGKVRLTNGTGTIHGIPDAAFGTLWIAPMEKGISIDELKAVREKKPEKKKTETLLETLKANIGRKIVWNHHGEKSTAVTAVLHAVSGTDDRITITMKNGAQTIAAQVSSYYDYFEFPEGFTDQVDDTTESLGLQIKTNSGRPDIPVQLVYFQSGIGWTPSYRIDLTDEKNAQIVLSSTLVNDVHNLSGTKMNLVVGYPHFLYAGIESPMTMKQSLSQFLQSLSGSDYSYSTSRYRSGLMNQSMGYAEMAMPSAPPEADYGSFKSLEGSSEGDLFFYDLSNVTLRKGERGQYNIFSASVPYAHIFEVSLPNALNEDGYTIQKKDPNEVWHSIRLENKSTQPWTTGSAITFQNGKPLGQDALKYTAVKSSVTVKITQSPDIRVTDEEKETSRKNEVSKKDGYYYDLVTIGGEILISNFKEKDIRITVTRPVTGKINSSSDQPKITQTPQIRSAVNIENTVVWDVSVKAGEQKKLTYTYDVLVRR